MTTNCFGLSTSFGFAAFLLAVLAISVRAADPVLAPRAPCVEELRRSLPLSAPEQPIQRTFNKAKIEAPLFQ